MFGQPVTVDDYARDRARGRRVGCMIALTVVVVVWGGLALIVRALT